MRRLRAYFRNVSRGCVGTGDWREMRGACHSNPCYKAGRRNFYEPMNCVFCQKLIPQFRAACDACVLEIAAEVGGERHEPEPRQWNQEVLGQWTAEPASEAKKVLSDSDKAPGNAGSESEREASIHADVFRPDETDLDYMRRRRRELGM